MPLNNCLCVGLNDNALTILLRALLKKKHVFCGIETVGIAPYAHNELSSSEAVRQIILDLGFILSSSRKPSSGEIRDAETAGKTILTHLPRHIDRIGERLHEFSTVITPYQSVRNRLADDYGVSPEKILLIGGIVAETKTAEAFPRMQTWVDEHY